MLDIRAWTFDDAFCDTARSAGGVHVRIARPPGAMVVLGAGSRPAVELDLDACAADGVALYRRRGGGCAVVLDPGNVIVSVAYPAPGFGRNQAHFDAISAWLIDGLAAAGCPGVRTAGVSDLVVGDRKVAGACLQRARDLLYYSAALLVDANLARLERWLRHPPREPDYRAGRRHRDFVSNLASLRPVSGAAELAAALEATLRPERLPVP